MQFYGSLLLVLQTTVKFDLVSVLLEFRSSMSMAACFKLINKILAYKYANDYRKLVERQTWVTDSYLRIRILQ